MRREQEPGPVLREVEAPPDLERRRFLREFPLLGVVDEEGAADPAEVLLSDEAEADNKPELEIFADDVACGHGATAGALDDNLLFYLRARGLPEKEAQALLIQAFVGEAIEGIADEALREVAMSQAQLWLEARS